MKSVLPTALGRKQRPPTIFLIIFDFQSDFLRKNALGAIRAFKRAFPAHIPESKEAAVMIIKTSNSRYVMDDLHQMLREIDNDDRFIHVDHVLKDEALHLLKTSVDCYVSLHRSEGYGLNLLEQILAGRIVVSSAYSGSEQFMIPLYADTAPELRIPVTLTHIFRPFGPYTTEMMWGEPDIFAAAIALRRVHVYRHYYREVALSIRERAVSIMSPLVLGRNIRSRLEDIRDCVCVLWKYDRDRKEALTSLRNDSIVTVELKTIWNWGPEYDTCQGLVEDMSRTVCLETVLGSREDLPFNIPDE